MYSQNENNYLAIKDTKSEFFFFFTLTFSHLPSHQRRSLWLSFCIQLSSIENSSTSVRSSLVIDSSTLPHPIGFKYQKIIYQNVYWCKLLLNNFSTNQNFWCKTTFTLLSSTNSTSWGVFFKLRSANNCIYHSIAIGKVKI